ncbi:MAG: hypothetical protein H6672_12655 [Anaerolineaceae bacterium]|nr:hypothetical protein [Anaerolineaceae bacterium]
MAVDYVIDYQCIPKQKLGVAGILERLKGRARAEAVIAAYREQGDTRPASQIGFEFTQSTPAGEQETKVLIAQDILDAAEELTPLEDHCYGCPANNTGQAFGCMAQVEYPLSKQGEDWLLKQLPPNREPLAWLLLRQAMTHVGKQEETLQALRATGRLFEAETASERLFGEFKVTSDNLFEMLFLSGHLRPSYAAMLLVFLNAIPRDLEADEIMHLSDSPEDALERYPFLLKTEPDDDRTVVQLKRFLRSLWLAWGLNVRMLLDV